MERRQRKLTTVSTCFLDLISLRSKVTIESPFFEVEKVMEKAFFPSDSLVDPHCVVGNELKIITALLTKVPEP